ncbi:MAG TPA: M14 family zinc carboxypeptidase, partial [Chitinophagaceae bacterium]|nr:M14 family zinc carboxypeptidase [Chitinophagaceae bacterium]
MNIKKCISVLFLFFLFSTVQAQEKFSKVKIYGPANSKDRADLIGLLQIDHFYGEDGAIVSEISERDLARLKNTPYKFEILVDDVAKNLEEQNREFFANRARSADNTQSRVAMEQVGQGLNSIITTPSAFVVQSTFGGYYSLAQMDAAMNALVATYPAIAQKILLGTTIENRQIWAIKISDNVTADEEGEPEVLYTGLQHAREAITGSSLIFFMQYLCEKYATDSKIKGLVDNRVFYIVPCV